MYTPDPEPLLSILKSFTGRVAFDVGANVGYVTEILSKNFDKVLAFEPAIESYSQLIKIQEKRKNIKCYNLAVGKVVGKLKLYITKNKIAIGQLVNVGIQLDFGNIIGEREIECITIDAICQKENVIPDFIKIDTEGFELDIIKGSLETLKYKPRLYIEIHSEQNGKEIYETLLKFYDNSMIKLIRHPHYKEGSTEWRNHYWLTIYKEVK